MSLRVPKGPRRAHCKAAKGWGQEPMRDALDVCADGAHLWRHEAADAPGAGSGAPARLLARRQQGGVGGDAPLHALAGRGAEQRERGGQLPQARVCTDRRVVRGRHGLGAPLEHALVDREGLAVHGRCVCARRTVGGWVSGGADAAGLWQVQQLGKDELEGWRVDDQGVGWRRLKGGAWERH